MKKYLLLSLLIVSTFFVYAMEKKSKSSSSFSLRSFLVWSSPNQMQHKSKLSDLQKSKNKFENQLRDKKIERDIKDISKMHISIALYNIVINPVNFLGYCYYLKSHKNAITMHLDDLDTIMLKKCRKTLLEDYSGLGAAIIAKDASIDEKRDFIEILINYNFKPTPKDIRLAELALYDGIAEHHKTFLHLLHTHSEAHWSTLPHEIRKYIAQYMVQLFKNEFWLLPEKSLNTR